MKTPTSKTPAAPAAPVTILRMRDVTARVGLAKSTVYDSISEGRFPAPIGLSGHTVGWLAHEVDAWLAERIAERDAGQRPDARGFARAAKGQQ